MTDQDDLILGVDGGGSKTVAWLAVRDAEGRVEVIGHGRSGSSNCRSLGFAAAAANLERAIEAAFEHAQRDATSVVRACLALAGADRKVDRQQFQSWASRRRLADRLTITNDAVPVLYAAAGDGVGIALISGTGSLAIGRNVAGEVTRCGGWGSVFGDEGSGYQIAVAGLRAVARAADGRGMQTNLLPRLLDHFKIKQPSELIPIVYSTDMDRSTLARLAPVIFDAAASGDTVAGKIVEEAAKELSDLVVTLAARWTVAEHPIVLGISGGVLLHQDEFVAAIVGRLAEFGISVTVVFVPDPVAGAVAIAKQ